MRTNDAAARPMPEPAASAAAFVGAWSLEAWSVTLANGVRSYPFGESAIGMICYSAEGTVHAHFSKSGRTRLGLSFEEIQALRRHLLGLAPDAPEGVDVDQSRLLFLRAALEFNGYCGHYEIVGREVRHRVTTAVIPEWEGVTLRRTFAFEADRLILSTENPLQQDRLVWRRVRGAV